MQVDGVLHLFDDNLLHKFFFCFGNAEIEFVVHLQNHFCFQIVTEQALMYA